MKNNDIVESRVVREINEKLSLIERQVDYTCKALGGLSEELAKSVTRVTILFVTVIKTGMRLSWLLLVLVIMAFFDEQIFHLTRRFFGPVSQTQIMIVIALIALAVAIVQTVIALRSMARGRDLGK